MKVRTLDHLLVVVLQLALLVGSARAHPASGIVVDQNGRVFIVYSGHGVGEIQPDGKLRYMKHSTGGHWLALDPLGSFSAVQPQYFERITSDGVKPALIFADGGAPITVGHDGNLYYASGPSSREPGGLALTRLSPAGQAMPFSPGLQKLLAEVDDGVTGLATGFDGTLFVASWTGLYKVAPDGTAAAIARPVVVSDCDEDRADHKPSNRLPLLRGLAADAAGNTFVAATSCHRVLKISPAGRVEIILKSERPWTPTGVALHSGDVYVLEYTNANGPSVEGWVPRIRKLGIDGKVTLIYSAITTN